MSLTGVAGTSVNLTAETAGTGVDNLNVVITPAGTGYTILNGNVGIGTTSPTTNKLVVVGDIRVGTSGTNGCLQGFDGAALVGSCSSDIKLKKDITSLSGTLLKITELNPVTYSWRADEFLDRGFGTGRVYGLIADEVQNVFPELVGMDDKGYKTVNYGVALQMLSIQAIKELNLNLDSVAGTITPLSGSPSETFVTAFFTNVKVVIGTWLADATNGVTDVFANVFNAKEKICVDGECLTKDDIHNLLLLAHPSPTGSGPSVPTPTPAPDPEPAPEPVTDPEPALEPDPVPAPAPEIVLDPIPAPEVPNP